MKSKLIIPLLAAAGLVLSLVTGCDITTVNFVGDSMSQSIKDGTHVIIDEAEYAGKLPSRGDIVAYKTPDSITHLGRVVAFPGDDVQIKAGAVYVNGAKLDEPYTAGTLATAD